MPLWLIISASLASTVGPVMLMLIVGVYTVLQRRRAIFSIGTLASAAGVVAAAAVMVTTGSPQASAIINGRPVNGMDYPYMAEIQTPAPSNGTYSCTGTLIAHDWVLTAAHCIHDDLPKTSVTVILASSDFTHPVFQTASSDWVVPPKYVRGGNGDWDVALVHLATTAPDYIQPVVLATAQDFTDLSTGFHQAFGYGTCVAGEDEQTNTWLRDTAMSNQLFPLDDQTFEAHRASAADGVAGCPGYTSAPPVTTPFIAQRVVAAAPTTFDPTPCPTPVPAVAHVANPTGSSLSLPPGPSDAPTPTNPGEVATAQNPPAYPGHGDSGGPLFGFRCDGSRVELGSLVKGGGRVFTYTNLASPGLSGWISKVLHDGTLAITTTTLPPATTGTSYPPVALTATGGALPYAWSTASGRLPAGLTLSDTGTISGTPTKAGTHTIVFRVTDAAGVTVDRTLSITVTKSK